MKSSQLHDQLGFLEYPFNSSTAATRKQKDTHVCIFAGKYRRHYCDASQLKEEGATDKQKTTISAPVVIRVRWFAMHENVTAFFYLAWFGFVK